MKRTSSQAVIASQKLYEALLAWVKKYPVLGVLGLLFGLILSFQLGRTTAAMPGEFSRAMAGMRLEILEQQREVDRLTQDNRSNINALAARLAELQAASTRLDALGEQYGIVTERRHFLNGSPAKEIHRFADENQVELVVLGTHGQKGVQLLLGATANSVLHGANCDVLAVRIRDSD